MTVTMNPSLLGIGCEYAAITSHHTSPTTAVLIENVETLYYTLDNDITLNGTWFLHATKFICGLSLAGD